jgi:hypothetical protein
MAWESRKGRGRYFTLSLWRGGRVVRQYLGRGAEAEKAAAENEARRADQRARREADRDWAGGRDEADAALGELHETTDLAMRAALIGHGFHQHDRGEWRRRRDVADHRGL